MERDMNRTRRGEEPGGRRNRPRGRDRDREIDTVREKQRHGEPRPERSKEDRG